MLPSSPSTTLAIQASPVPPVCARIHRWNVRPVGSWGPVAAIAGVWFNSSGIAILIAIALTINMVFAAIAGSLLPLLLQRIGIDPALAGSVLLTTVTDVVGFMAFLGLGTWYLL